MNVPSNTVPNQKLAQLSHSFSLEGFIKVIAFATLLDVLFLLIVLKTLLSPG